ncbi:phage major capsid protein [Mangrovicoccus ximenensis]|uniref:phage major capsid protein n=1 Tax=Mangrovicoccus ximenensis TaxID=1911570 RepID=UPI000D3CE131|nr:Mu-like prophage major head subunit gpT family protein [Mangrovicoccus ximenensis]
MTKRFTADPARASRVTPISTGKPDTTAGELLTRKAELGSETEERTFSAVIATSTPVQRRDKRGPFLEVLDPAGLQFAEDSDVPLLTDHRASARETVGRAFGFAADGDQVTATLRLGAADDIEPLHQRVQDGTLKHVSAGYRVQQWSEATDPQTGQRTKTAVRWQILEVSLTPVPADHRAVIRRSNDMPFDNPETRDDFVETIRSALNLPEKWAEELAEDLNEDGIRKAAQAELLKRQAPRIRVTRSHDDPQQIHTRAADALAFRMTGGELPEASREYVGMSLLDHAKDSLQRSGVSTRGMAADDVLQRSSMGTSDFPLLVSNAMGKVAAQAYQSAESPLKALARQRVLPNFKTSTSIRIGEMGQLEEMTEHGEFKHVSRAEVGEEMTLKTFGRAINVSRKLIIDDDLGLLGDMTSAMGQAAAQTEAAQLVNLLTSNPEMSDGTPVFDASRGSSVFNEFSGNYASFSKDTSDAVNLAWAWVTAARFNMRNAKGGDGSTVVKVTPKYIVVGPVYETHGMQLLSEIQAAVVSQVNPHTHLELIVDPYLGEATNWYLMADPATMPCLQYGYLASAQGVQIQRQESWDTLGLKYRAYLDFGCGWLDWRGAALFEGV